MNFRTAGVGILCLLLVGGVFLVCIQPEEARASFTSEEVADLVEYLESDAALNLRLIGHSEE